jgi:hypothetical protein
MKSESPDMKKFTQCEVCGNKDFRILVDSVLFRRYPFIYEKNLRFCSICGAKYIICENCDALMNRVHLSLDKYGMVSSCLRCGWENRDITQWLKNND